nr:MAG TPA: Protein of unknown function (DUF938) [Caudoviricetes sp.]
MSWLFDEAPPRGRFVAVHSDGTASLYWWDEDGVFLDADAYFVYDEKPFSGEEMAAWLKDCGFTCWQALPEDFRFAWEGKE